MSTHINAKQGEVSNKVILPGDPLRAKHIAETYLEDVVCYNTVRGMLGYTGFYKGKRVSIQGTGMGIPSISIYVNELLRFFSAETLIRVGTCGALHKDLKIKDIVIAQSASTNSNVNRLRFDHVSYAPTADFSLIYKAYEYSKNKGINTHVKQVLTSDLFYNPRMNQIDNLVKYGIVAAEMETAELYTLAAEFGAKALSLLTVSDHLITGEETTAEERQLTFHEMMIMALEII